MRGRLWFITCDLYAEAGDVILDGRVPETNVKLQVVCNLIQTLVVHLVTCLSAGVTVVIFVAWEICRITGPELTPAEILTEVLVAGGVDLCGNNNFSSVQ